MKGLEKVVVDNSPAILSGIAVAGTVATAIFAAKGAIKMDSLRSEQAPWELWETKDKFKLIYIPCFAPAVGMGAVTIVCIVMSNQIGTRRAAAVATAYAISEKAWVQYKDKVVEHIGEKEERKIRDEVAQDQITNNPLVGNQVIMVPGRAEQLCYEAFTGRYFMSSMESLKKAQNDLNYKLLHNQYASVSDFYDLLGLPHTDTSEEMGWRSEELLELDFSTCLDDEARPAISFSYRVQPIRDYYRCWA